MKKNTITGILVLVVIILTVFYSYYSLMPHSNSDKEYSLTEFSPIRAMEHVKNMSEDYHFVGTPYHDKVKKYIIKELEELGLNVEVQEQFAFNDKWRGAIVNENILARIKGENQGKALMLLAHYDSAPFASRGASDDAVGVATILEGVRAFIKSEDKPKQDIIVLISDGEEIGLLGAKAFVKHHPWAKDVGLVINFEARGSGGPSYALLETNGGNEKMLKHFSNANPNYPIANSFLYSVYKMLPNDTDLTVFRELANIDGYNFAFIDDFYDYHSITDNFENVDINTVEHQGDYLMTLLDYIKGINFENIKTNEDYVYFNFPLLKMVFYPFSWVLPLALLTLLFSIILFWISYKKQKVKPVNVLKGFIPFILTLIGNIIICILGWKLILLLHPSYNDILHGFPYNGHYYIAGFVFLTIALTLLFYKSYWEKLNLLEILIAPLFFWIMISMIFVFVIPGASFLIIPVYFFIIIFGIELLLNIKMDLKIILYTVLTIPGLLILSPFIDMFPVGLRMVSMPVSIVFTVLSLALIFPVLKGINFKKELLVFTFILTFVLFGLAEFNSGFNENKPKPNSLNYLYYADDDLSFWETNNQVIDKWLEGVMGKNLKQGSYGIGDLDSKYNAPIRYHAKAKKVNLTEPNIAKTQEIIIDGVRNVEFTITPQRKVNRFDLIINDDFQFESMYVNGVKYSKNRLLFTLEDSRMLSYYITRPNEILRIRFSFDPDFVPSIMLYEISYDLIENSIFGVPERPNDLIPMPFIINDCSIIVKKLKF